MKDLLHEVRLGQFKQIDGRQGLKQNSRPKKTLKLQHINGVSMSKKMSRKLVPVGTHIDPTTEVILQALAESQDTTIYALIQEMIDKTVKEYEEELDSLRGGEVSGAESAPDDELLG